MSAGKPAGTAPADLRKPWPFPVSVLADGRVVRHKLPRPARQPLARLPAAPW